MWDEISYVIKSSECFDRWVFMKIPRFVENLTDRFVRWLGASVKEVGKNITKPEQRKAGEVVNDMPVAQKKAAQTMDKGIGWGLSLLNRTGRIRGLVEEAIRDGAHISPELHAWLASGQRRLPDKLLNELKEHSMTGLFQSGQKIESYFQRVREGGLSALRGKDSSTGGLER